MNFKVLMKKWPRLWGYLHHLVQRSDWMKWNDSVLYNSDIMIWRDVVLNGYYKYILEYMEFNHLEEIVVYQ